MKLLSSLLILSLIIISGCKQQTALETTKVSIEPEDLNLFVGEWKGSLTYINYSNNEPYTMPANLVVKKGASDTEYLLNNIFPNESSANNTDKLTISKDRTLLNNQPIVSRKELPTGEIQIITESNGRDNRKKALIRHIYLIGKERYSDTKKVKFEGSSEWMQRNEFSYEREK